MSVELHEADLADVLSVARLLASRYRELTGRPLGITGEVGEAAAASLLKLRLAPHLQDGFDAIDSDGKKVQIKTRCLEPSAKLIQRLGGIKLESEWDYVLFVRLDPGYNTVAIYRADRGPLEAALSAPGSKARNERGQLQVRQFLAIATEVWPDQPQS
ncbi:MAG: hypothetical protein AAGF47_08995 [Planctomycetota bacterium]